jgi:hypothetical protein
MRHKPLLEVRSVLPRVSEVLGQVLIQQLMGLEILRLFTVALQTLFYLPESPL